MIIIKDEQGQDWLMLPLFQWERRGDKLFLQQKIMKYDGSSQPNENAEQSWIDVPVVEQAKINA